MASSAMIFKRIVITIALLLTHGVQWSFCAKEALFMGAVLNDFFDSCTPRANPSTPCIISSPQDFIRLNQVKGYVEFQLEFILSPHKLGANLLILIIILILTIHLIIVRRFDWKSLPLVNLYYTEVQDEIERKNGVRYRQYIWMRYSVLEGNHPVFRKRALNEMIWYKYKTREAKFDYESIPIRRFKFLDKATLTKHTMELEKEAADHEDDHGPHNILN